MVLSNVRKLLSEYIYFVILSSDLDIPYVCFPTPQHNRWDMGK